MTVTVSRQVGYTTGVLLDSLMRDLGGGRGQVSLVGSLQVSCGYCAAVYCGDRVKDYTDDCYTIKMQQESIINHHVSRWGCTA